MCLDDIKTTPPTTQPAKPATRRPTKGDRVRILNLPDWKDQSLVGTIQVIEHDIRSLVPYRLPAPIGWIFASRVELVEEEALPVEPKAGEVWSTKDGGKVFVRAIERNRHASVLITSFNNLDNLDWISKHNRHWPLVCIWSEDAARIGLRTEPEPKPAFLVAIGRKYKTRSGRTVVVSHKIAGDAPRLAHVVYLDTGAMNRIWLTGEAHDDMSECPDDVIEAVA